MSDTQSSYVVVGSGIVGLYTTYCLINRGKVKGNKITVVAEFLPGDQSINYTSPWAGGNFSGISPSDQQSMAFDRFTYTNLAEIQEKLGKDCGLDYRPATEFWEFEPNKDKLNSLKEYLKDFRIHDKNTLKGNVKFGVSYTTWNFNCPIFLQNLANYLKSLGVTFIQKRLGHISQGFLHFNTKVVFNCTGIGAKSIGGVKDDKVYSVRGQVIVVRAPHINENKVQWGSDYATYIIPRPNSRGELVLGGYMDKDIYTGDTYKTQTDDIIQRTTELLPEILDQPLDILRTVAGLRPGRFGGVRIESEIIEGGKIVVHNYGAGGYGYQSGFGMSAKAVSLMLKEVNKSKLKL